MTTYQDRVRNELTDLQQKIIKLAYFQASPMCAELDAEDRNLLQEQKNTMLNYAVILTARIARFKE